MGPLAGEQTQERHRLATRLLAILLGVAVLGIFAAYRLKGLRSEKHLPNLKNLPSNVDQQLSGYSFTRSDNGKKIFSVHATRTIAFKQGGTTVLEDVAVEIFGQSGDRHDLLKTERCQYDLQTGGFFAPGKVEIELNVPADAKPQDSPALRPAPQGARGRGQPLFLVTSRVTFTHPNALLVTDQPVGFQIGPARGTARGMAYATQGGWIDMRNDVKVELASGQKKDSPPIQLSAQGAHFEKKSGIVTLTGPITIDRGEGRATASKGSVLLDGHDRVTQAELEGRVRVSIVSQGGKIQASAEHARAGFEPEGTALRNLEAEGDVRVESRRAGKFLELASQGLRISFSGNPARPVSGDAFGNVRVNAQNAPDRSRRASPRATASRLETASQELTAAKVRFAFRPGSWILNEATTVESGKLVLTSDNAQSGQRVITANPFVMTFNALGKLETLRGRSRPTIVFEPPPASPATLPAESTSDRLEARLEPATEEIRTVDQFGNFQYRQGARQASADRAHYQAEDDLLKLSGKPRVWDNQTRTLADHILLILSRDTAEGVGHVQSTHLEDPGNGAGEPINVAADRMRAEQKNQFVHYVGHVRLWQGRDVLESSSLDVYKNQRRISSGSQVISSFLEPATHLASGGLPANQGQNETQPVTIRAEHLEYFEEGRKAVYRGNVRLETENTTLLADRMDLYFSPTSSPGASEVERAVADGNVTVTQPGRRATGEHAEYFAAAERMELTGGPPTLYDADKGFTTGQRLTFFLRDDRIFLDGGEKSPTYSRHRIPQ